MPRRAIVYIHERAHPGTMDRALSQARAACEARGLQIDQSYIENTTKSFDDLADARLRINLSQVEVLVVPTLRDLAYGVGHYLGKTDRFDVSLRVTEQMGEVFSEMTERNVSCFIVTEEIEVHAREVRSMLAALVPPLQEWSDTSREGHGLVSKAGQEVARGAGKHVGRPPKS